MPKVKKEKIDRFNSALQKLLLTMQGVDASCMEMSKDLSKREFTLLVYLGENGYAIMSDVSGFLQVPMSTATGIVDKLVEKGYFMRFHSEEDRRTVMVTLGKHGKELYQYLQQQLAKMCTRILGDLTDKQQDDFVSLLEKATSNLQFHIGTPEPVL